MYVSFAPIWSWMATIATIAGLIAFVALTYPRRVRHLPRGRRVFLIGMRFATALAIGVALLRPAIEWKETDKNQAVLFVLVDDSRSMTTEDGVGGKSRREAVLQLLDENSPRFEALGEDVEIRFFNFAEGLSPVDYPDAAAEGDQSAIGAALKDLAREAQGQRVAGVLLMSDGAQRAVEPYDVDPRGVARLFAERRIPIYTVGFGSSGLTGNALDLAVEDLIVDPVVFEKKSVPISAKIRALGAAGQRAIVRLLVEKRAGRVQGTSGEMTVPSAGRNARPSMELTIDSPKELKPIELSFVPESAGEYKLAVEVVPLDRELKLANNRLETIISVQKGGIRVAYFDVLRPEQKFLGNINTSDKIELDFQWIRGGKFEDLNEIDPVLFQRGECDAYIIGDVPARIFGPENLKQLAQRVEEGAGLLMTGGFHNFAAGGYAETPLAPYIPVKMRASDQLVGDEIDLSQHHTGDLQMLPTQLGLNKFVMRLDSPERNSERWRSLPPLNGANRLRAKNPYIEIWAQTPDQIPLLFAVESGKTRVAAFAGDSTFLWFIDEHDKYTEHQRFWRQMILWLTHKEMDGDAPVWVRVDPRNFTPNQRVEIEFGARDDQGTPIQDADFLVEVRSANGETEKPTPRSSGDTFSAEFTQTGQPGDYWIRVAATRDGTAVGPDAWTRFIVDERDLELDNPDADLALLDEIANTTGGYSIVAEEFGDFLDGKIRDGLANAEVTVVSQIRLWDNWTYLLIFVGLMSIEWFVRKRRGLV